MAIGDIYNAVLNYEVEKVPRLVQAELSSGADLTVILNQGLIAPMDEVGRLFGEGVLFIPEMLRAAKAMKGGLEILRPLLTKTEAKPRGRVVIGTVKGDLHDIGKNLVGMMIEGAGFQVIDLGVDVGTDQFIAAAARNDAQLICMSALLTTTMPSMAEATKSIKEQGLPFKVIIGGAPVTQAYADRIGADGYSSDAAGAVRLVKRILDRRT